MTVVNGIDISALEELLNAVRWQSQQPYPWSTQNCNRNCQLFTLVEVEFARRFDVGPYSSKGQRPNWRVFGPYLLPLLAIGGPAIVQNLQRAMLEDFYDEMTSNIFERLIREGNFVEIVRRGDKQASTSHNVLARVLATELQSFIVSVLRAEEAGRR